MKKLFAILVAAMLVMAMSVTAFAATASIITDAAKTTQAEVASIPFALPAGLTLETGDVVTVYIKGTATNDAVRIYFTDNVDNGRVCDAMTIEVVDGVFETTIDITIDTTGAIQGTAAPSVLLLKGPSYGVNLTDVAVEVVEITSDKIAGAAEEPAEDTAATTEYEAVYSEELSSFKSGSWEICTLGISTSDFIEALKTPGAYVVITRSNPSEYTEFIDGNYEKFCFTDGAYSLNLGVRDDGKTINRINMGTLSHTFADVGDVQLDAAYDDGTVIWYAASDLLPLWETWTGSEELLLISNTSTTSYNIVNFEIVVPATSSTDAPVEDTPAEDTSAEEETEAPAETGLALAVVPMIVAAAAVVLSKKR